MRPLPTARAAITQCGLKLASHCLIAAPFILAINIQWENANIVKKGLPSRRASSGRLTDSGSLTGCRPQVEKPRLAASAAATTAATSMLPLARSNLLPGDWDRQNRARMTASTREGEREVPLLSPSLTFPRSFLLRSLAAKSAFHRDKTMLRCRLPRHGRRSHPCLSFGISECSIYLNMS